MIELVVAREHGQRLAAARAFVTSFSAGTEILLLGASRESLDDFVRSEIAPHGATFGLHRFSLMQLASHLAAGEMAAREAAPSTRLGMEAVAARAAFEANKHNEMPRFAAVARFPGFPRALASTLDELRLAGIAAASLPADFAALLRRYEKALEDAGLVDHALLLELAQVGVRHDAHARLRRMPLLMLDLALPTALEADLVGAVSAESARTLATIPADDEPTRQAFERLGGRTTQSAEGGATRKRARTQTATNSLARLRTHLFSDVTPPDHEPDESVRFFSAPGEGRECVEIARQIAHASQSGVPFDDMAVVLRSPDIYASLLDTALRRAGIPSWFSRGTQRPDAAGRAFLALLACRCEGLSARRFAEYLSFAQVPKLDEQGAPPTSGETWAAPEADELGAAAMAARGVQRTVAPSTATAVQLTLWDLDGDTRLEAPAKTPDSETDTTSADTAGASPGGAAPHKTASDDVPDDHDSQPALEGTLRAPWKWEELLVEAAVIGGRARWSRRLRGLEHELQLQAQALRDVEPESPRLPALQRDLVNLGHLARFALPIIEALDAWPELATWGDWMQALRALVPRVLRHPDRVLSVLSEMQPMAKVGPVSLDEVREVLSERLATLEQSPPPSRYGRVFVAPPEQLRGRSFAVVFVPGLAERLFPQRPREDPLLLDATRQDISPRLRTQTRRGREERLLLELAVGAARDHLVLSYPRLDSSEARPRVPSFYALDMARAIRGAIPDFEALERDAAARAQARLAWPSPPESRDAIDAMEHDLAVLGAFLHRDAAERSRGRARYLLELSPCLARSLRARWLRWSSVWRPQDGLVRSTAALEALLEAQRPTQRPYSVTALQKFATCPYQFVLSAMHRIEPRREAVSVVQLDPLTRGRIFHHVQADVLRRLRAAGQLPLTEEAIDASQGVLDDSLDRLAAAYRDDLAPAIERIWDDEIDTMRADLRRWLRGVARDATWKPIHFEFAFGLSTARVSEHERASTGGRAGAGAGAETDRASSEPVRLHEGYLLRGAVDLVEEHASDGTLRVTDHKTGRNPTRVGLIVGGGETLQPVLYALAVHELLQRDVAEGRLSYCTSRGGFSERIVPIGDFARLYARMVLQTLDRSIEKGFLPPAPRRDACKFCDFRVVCGPHEEVRSRRKTTPTLHYLEELRSLP